MCNTVKCSQPSTRKQRCKWPGRHYDPTEKLGTYLCLLWASAPSKAGKKTARFLFPICLLTLPFLQGKESCSHIAQEWTWTLRHVPTAWSLLTKAAFMLFNSDTGLVFPAQRSHSCLHQCHSTHDTGAIGPHHQCCSYLGVQATKTNFIWYQKV